MIADCDGRTWRIFLEAELQAQYYAEAATPAFREADADDSGEAVRG
jgi:hypothetical protein